LLLLSRVPVLLKVLILSRFLILFKVLILFKYLAYLLPAVLLINIVITVTVRTRVLTTLTRPVLASENVEKNCLSPSQRITVEA
jgi:hypothetical protein